MGDPKSVDEQVVDYVYRKAGQISSGYGYYKKIKTAKTYYGIVKGLLDEDTRDGALLQASFEATKAIGGKALGNSFFFDYHKNHFEALANVLNASGQFDRAIAALDQAVKAADSAEALTNGLNDFNHRKNQLKLRYALKLQNQINTIRRFALDPVQTQKDLDGAGTTIQQVGEWVGRDLPDWQNDVCDLCFDCMQLYYLVGSEYQITVTAMAQYNAKLKKLQDSDKNIDYIAGKGLEKRRDEEEVWRYLQRNKPNSPDSQAVHDPTGYAQRQLEKVTDTLGVLTTICDVAMSDAVYNPDLMNTKIGSL